MMNFELAYLQFEIYHSTFLNRHLPAQREAAADTSKNQCSPSPKPVRPQN